MEEEEEEEESGGYTGDGADDYACDCAVGESFAGVGGGSGSGSCET